jgi:hypothetical protein
LLSISGSSSSSWISLYNGFGANVSSNTAYSPNAGGTQGLVQIVSNPAVSGFMVEVANTLTGKAKWNVKHRVLHAKEILAIVEE